MFNKLLNTMDNTLHPLHSLLVTHQCTFLPTIQDLYTSRVRKRAGKITADPSHPGHKLFKLLTSGRRYRSLFAKTSRHKNSFWRFWRTVICSVYQRGGVTD